MLYSAADSSIFGVAGLIAVVSPPPPHTDFTYSNMCVHKALQKLKDQVDLKHQCGYITMLNSNNRHRRRASDSNECRGGGGGGGGQGKQSEFHRVCVCLCVSLCVRAFCRQDV